MSNPLVDMQKPDVIFCIGTNMTECHPVAATGLKKAIARGAKLIVADPRRIGLADISDLYLPLRVGSDTALLLGMAHVIAREGLVNETFIKTALPDLMTSLSISASGHRNGQKRSQGCQRRILKKQQSGMALRTRVPSTTL